MTVCIFIYLNTQGLDVGTFLYSYESENTWNCHLNITFIIRIILINLNLILGSKTFLKLLFTVLVSVNLSGNVIYLHNQHAALSVCQ